MIIQWYRQNLKSFQYSHIPDFKYLAPTGPLFHLTSIGCNFISTHYMVLNVPNSSDCSQMQEVLGGSDKQQHCPIHMRKAHRRSRGIALLITSALDGGEWSISHPSCFLTGKNPSANWKGGWVGPRACLDNIKKIFDPARSWTQDHPACSLVTKLTTQSQLH
jgi:hypothetical protein